MDLAKVKLHFCGVFQVNGAKNEIKKLRKKFVAKVTKNWVET